MTGGDGRGGTRGRMKRRRRTVEWRGEGNKDFKRVMCSYFKNTNVKLVCCCVSVNLLMKRMKGIIPPLLPSPRGVRHPF